MSKSDARFDPPLELQAKYWKQDPKTGIIDTEVRIVTIHKMSELESINAGIIPELTPEVAKEKGEGFWRWAIPLQLQLALHVLEVTGHLVPDES